MEAVQRFDYDSVPIRDAKIDDQTGFLYVRRVPIAQAMVQSYYKADGTETKEAKLPKYILSDSTVASANEKPVTNDHPGVLVTKSNSREYMRGFTTSNAHVEGNVLYNDVAITDADLIKAIQNGKKELSIGFETEVVPETGEYNGVKYDHVQKNIKINHLAVVQRGRAGHNVRLVGDSAENVAPSDSPKKGKSMETKVVRVDGQDITVAAEDVSKVTKLDADNSAKAKQIAELKAQQKALQDKIDKLEGNSKSADEAQAKADSLEADNKKLKEEIKQLKGDGLDQRLDLIDKVKTLVGDSAYDYHGKSVRDMKIDAVKAIKGDSMDFDGKSDTYVDAAFDMLETPKSTAGYAGPTQKNDSVKEDEADLFKARDAAYGY